MTGEGKLEVENPAESLRKGTRLCLIWVCSSEHPFDSLSIDSVPDKPLCEFPPERTTKLSLNVLQLFRADLCIFWRSQLRTWIHMPV
jgi:hypothetical protein